MTLLPGIALEAGTLKGTRLVARRFAVSAPSRTLALAARLTSPRRRDADLLAEFRIEHRRRPGHAGVPAARRHAPGA